ncbi:MAG: sigma-70 family RNA polymerase sigma factor [Gaiellaceae bacterium]
MSRRSPALSLSGRRRQLAAGERISELFEQHGRMVYGVCRLILRDPSEAEDAAQQTFLSAYTGLLGGQEPRDPSAWLGTIARNECRARLRSRTSEPLALVTESSVDETQREVGRRAEAEALCSALAELAPQQRDAIVLREFYGLSYAEVGAALGLSGAAVESLLFRGRRRLQDQLRPLRAALGALTLPPGLEQSLTRALPGFGGGAGAGAGAAVIAKVGAAPLAAKLAAATLALGTAGTVAGLETSSRARAPHHTHAAAHARVQQIESLAAPARGAADVALTPTASGSGENAQAGGDQKAAMQAGDGGARSEPQHQDGSGSTGHQTAEPKPAEKPSGGDGGQISSGNEASPSGGSGDSGSTTGTSPASSQSVSTPVAGSSHGDGTMTSRDSGD